MWGTPWSRELSPSESDGLWATFTQSFAFRPDYYEKTKPAIQEPKPSVVFDVSAVNDEHVDRINAHALQALRNTTSVEAELIFLDWQHASFSFNPHDDRIGTELPVIPDGDYFILVASDFSYGTFGHPWQETVCVFGERLIDNLPAQLFDELPVVRRVV
jgi:Protein of unknown function (DUF2716)